MYEVVVVRKYANDVISLINILCQLAVKSHGKLGTSLERGTS